MIRKIKAWWKTRHTKMSNPATQETFSRAEVIELLAQARQLAYNDGKRDGLSIAREQATKSLKEILWQQNQTASPTNKTK